VDCSGVADVGADVIGEGVACDDTGCGDGVHVVGEGVGCGDTGWMELMR